MLLCSAVAIGSISAGPAASQEGSGSSPDATRGAPHASPPALFPIEDLEVGMRGVGRTVFQGNTIEEFDIEILGVMRNSRPQGDLILFRGFGETLEHAGIIRGMSGSPVYIDGKLVGAVSFAYPGTIDPIGAITPIGEMLPLLRGASGEDRAGNGGAGTRGDGDMLDPTPGTRRSAEGHDEMPDPATGTRRSADGEDGMLDPTTTARRSGDESAPASSWNRFQGAWREFLSPASSTAGAFGGSSPSIQRNAQRSSWMPAAPPRIETNGFAPLTTPVSMSGWSSELAGPMTAAMQGLGFAAAAVPGGQFGSVAGAASGGQFSSVSGGQPAAAGGASGAQGQGDASSLVPGSAVGVRLIGGDADLVAIGTVTYVDSERILAFGHPMMQAGDVAFPMTGAWIHTVIPNMQVSMKMGSSTGLLGGVWNDRRTGIAGAFGTVPQTLPVSISIEDGRGDTQHFSYTVVRDKSLTPFLLPWTVANSYLVSGWVSGDAYVETVTDVYFDGGQHLRRVDRTAAEAPGVELGADATLPATLLLINPWEETRLDSVRVDVKYEPGNRSARVVEVRRSAARVHVGETVRIEAAIEPFRGQVETYGFDLTIPDAWAGRSLDVYVGGTNDFVMWDQDRAPEKMVPHDLPHMISLIEKVPDDSQINLRVYSRETGTLIRGEEIPALPTSLARATRNVPHVAGPRQISGSLLEERHLTTPWVVSGGERVSLEVAQQ